MPFCIQCGTQTLGQDRYCQRCLSQSSGPTETASAAETTYMTQPQAQAQPQYQPQTQPQYQPQPQYQAQAQAQPQPQYQPQPHFQSQTPFQSQTAYSAPGITPGSFYFNLFKDLLAKPNIALPQFLTYNNAYPGLLVALVSAVLIGLTSLLIVQAIVSELSDILPFINGFDMLGNSDLKIDKDDIPYFSIFIKVFLSFVLQWALLSLMTLASAKIFSSRITALQAFNAAGAAQLFLAVATVAAFILSYIKVYIGLVIFSGGSIALYIALHKAIEPALAANNPRNPYVIPLTAAGTGFINILLLQILN